MNNIVSKNIFIDFDDSFTYNIKEFFHNISLEFELINWRERERLKSLEFQSGILLLGPGPGHIEDYQEFIHHYLANYLNNQNIKKIGICLGHQILMNYLYGLKIEKSKFPMHGRSVNLIDLHGESAQRYNSLVAIPERKALENVEQVYDQNGELALTYSNQHLSMQFHPESVGTKLQKLQLKDLISTLVYA